MTYKLENIVRIGKTAVAVLSRTTISRRCVSNFYCFVCDKRPVAVLTFAGTKIGALGINGEPVALDDLGRLCPGVVEDFAAACAAR